MVCNAPPHGPDSGRRATTRNGRGSCHLCRRAASSRRQTKRRCREPRPQAPAALGRRSLQAHSHKQHRYTCTSPAQPHIITSSHQSHHTHAQKGRIRRRDWPKVGRRLGRSTQHRPRPRVGGPCGSITRFTERRGQRDAPGCTFDHSAPGPTCDAVRNTGRTLVRQLRQSESHNNYHSKTTSAL